jgi:DNA-binding Lrp family transcriptional regulator
MNNARQTLRELSPKIGLTAPSIKKRIDRLVEVGFIKDYTVALGNKYIDATAAIVIARTDGSVNPDIFIEQFQDNRAIFLILPIVSGELFLRVMYTKRDELSALRKKITDFKGVESVDVHVTYVYESESTLSDFTSAQLRVLSQLTLNPRLPTHEIAARSGLSVKIVEQQLEAFVREEMVTFGIKWNPFGKGTSVAVAPIRFDSNQTTPESIDQWLTTHYPIEFWYSRTSKDDSLIFAILGVSDIKKLEDLTRDLQNQKWVETVSVMIGYSSVNPDSLPMTLLIDLLKNNELWPPSDRRV